MSHGCSRVPKSLSLVTHCITNHLVTKYPPVARKSEIASCHNSSASGDKESDDHSHAGAKRPRDYESSDTDDSGPIILTKKSKWGGVHEATKLKSSSQRSGDTSKSSPKNKKSKDRKPRNSSSGKRPSGKLWKSSRMSKPYDSLTAKELLTIEVLDTHCSSWMSYGICVQPTSNTKTSIGQTPGFPDFDPHKHNIARLKKRWSSKNYQALLDEMSAPWETMYLSRRTELYFHRREDVCPMVLADIEELASLMNKHTQALWERMHWVTMDPDADLKSGEQYKERGLRRLSLCYRAAVTKVLGHKDFPETLMFELGNWKIPDKYCPWIWQDPRARELGGPKFLSLHQQLEAIDSAEPASTQ
ncbi:hypothetical protein P3T76_016045 [Phytophthora citrophthora]|uniref:Uncharacterized protein n=1 Tax=Phytophthora citrophthora TaxID=4793 RepID=A0AAD9FYN5_9STRA|nr:hypothetical protein P3T76_016045 [Phytophthora citrophthora]